MKSKPFLNELLKDVALISDRGFRLNAPVILTTHTLKQRIIDECGSDISFYKSGKYLMVHASDVNPCEYVTAALHGCGLSLQYGLKSIQYLGAKLWNELPVELRNASSKTFFKTKLKSYFLNKVDR